MRLLPSRYDQPKPQRAKPLSSKVKHFTAPLKGLNLDTRKVEGDLLTATIMDNFIVEENQIRIRPGYKLVIDYAKANPVERLIPYSGTPSRLLAAIDGELRHVAVGGDLLLDGFNSNDWHWTAFSNLSDTKYTVMVNGADGVWSWDGGLTATDPIPGVAVVSISNTYPAVCTVASGDIDKFTDGMFVTIAGVIDTGMEVCNGTHRIANVGSPANTFELVGVDATAAAPPGTVTGTITVDVPGSGMVKELVTAPVGEAWVVPDSFHIVLSHMNRLWFADPTNLAVYYLDIQAKSGQLSLFPLSAVFRHGGSIRAMAAWTRDGGAGLDDVLAIFSTQGECVLFSGIDPDTPENFQLVGIFHFDAPMSKHSVLNYGGDLYVLIGTGLVPMSKLIQSETAGLGRVDQSVYTEFLKSSMSHRGLPGWSVVLIHNTGRMVCNMPDGGADKYRQMVRFMPNPIWASWSAVPSRCWCWENDRIFFGSDKGKVYEGSPSFLSDDGKAIVADVQMAWSSYGTPARKHFKMIKPYILTDGLVKPYVDMHVDNEVSKPKSQPATNLGSTQGADWNTATWDVDYWAIREQTNVNFSGIGRLGNVGAIRLTASVFNCNFAVTAFDVLWEPGSIFG
jgi:hypothetical protein